MKFPTTSTLLALASGLAAVTAFGPTKGAVPCTGYGEFCSSDVIKGGSETCVKAAYPLWNTFNKGSFDKKCDVTKPYTSCKILAGQAANAVCSNTTKRCVVPSYAKCTNPCLNRKAYCSSLYKSCVVPDYNPKSQCNGWDVTTGQGSCATGQRCDPFIGQCVTLGLPCLPKTNKLMFRYLTPQKDGSIRPKRCGDVDGGSRLPAAFFAPGNVTSILAYIRITTQQYQIPGMGGDGSNPYLSQGDCATLGYTKAVGSEVKPWAPVAMMNNIAKSYSCDCTFPDCPDVPHLPTNRFYPNQSENCALLGPKFNAPIKINFWEMQ